MPLSHLEGREYHASLSVTEAAVRAFVETTTDDGRRWVHHAPPSFAAAALFAVAPDFLFDEAVGAYSSMLIHADQTFEFHSPIEVGMDLEVAAHVDRVRMRGDVGWVTFLASASAAGTKVLDSSSLFLMSATAPPATSSPRPEPGPNARRAVDTPGGLTLRKSASRADLIRYAAVTGDFNPLHWDHQSAVAAGFPGVVVHGLLAAAWATQVVPPRTNTVMPVKSVRHRFAHPVLPDTQLTVTGGVPEDGRMTVTITSEDADDPAVTATIELE